MMGLNELIKANNERVKAKREYNINKNKSLWDIESLGSFNRV